jgi:hypothetical protein
MLILSMFFAGISSCSYTKLKNTDTDSSSKRNLIKPEYVVVPNLGDSIQISTDTKYYYRYKFEALDEWSIEPELALTNLYYHGIKVIEAWYSSGPNVSRDGNGVTKIMRRPGFVVGLANDCADIWRYHYEPALGFDPITASKGKMRHYVFKGMKNDGR